MKTLTIPNANNKLSCDVFIHITLAPPVPLFETDFPKRFLVQDKAQEPTISFEADMITMARCKLHELSSVITFASHGIPADEFIKQNQKGMNASMAVYVYKKIKQ